MTTPLSDRPRVSVCLLAYNHARSLRDTVRSVLEQDFEDYELILSDDCSSDATWEIILAIAEADPRVRPVRTPRNLGMAGNANFAVAQARAPFIALLHHDDICERSLLRRWVEVIERDPDIAFVSNGYGAYGNDAHHKIPLAERTDGREVLEKFVFPVWGCPFRGTAMVRRTCWDAVGGMRERFGLLADVDLWMRLAARWSVGYVADPLIIVKHDRPADYPSAYVDWTWYRTRLLYEIHGHNRIDYYGRKGLRNRARWAEFRLRVSKDTVRWLAYAVVKRRWAMLETSDELANEFELPPVRWLRRTLALASSAAQPRTR
jgi:glycosyltransferase involved in cell wall biosynthesis